MANKLKGFKLKRTFTLNQEIPSPVKRNSRGIIKHGSFNINDYKMNLELLNTMFKTNNNNLLLQMCETILDMTKYFLEENNNKSNFYKMK